MATLFDLAIQQQSGNLLNESDLAELQEAVESEVPLAGPIYSRCIDVYAGIVEVCVTAYLDRACAEVKVLGVGAGRVCGEYTIEDGCLVVRLRIGTINTGIWRLERSIVTVKVCQTGGAIYYSGHLKQYVIDWDGASYRTKKRWQEVEVADW